MSSHSAPGCAETAVQRSESKRGPRLSCHRLLATAGGWDGTCRPLLRVLPAIPRGHLRRGSVRGRDQEAAPAPPHGASSGQGRDSGGGRWCWDQKGTLILPLTEDIPGPCAKPAPLQHISNTDTVPTRRQVEGSSWGAEPDGVSSIRPSPGSGSLGQRARDAPAVTAGRRPGGPAGTDVRAGRGGPSSLAH